MVQNQMRGDSGLKRQGVFKSWGEDLWSNWH